MSSSTQRARTGRVAGLFATVLTTVSTTVLTTVVAGCDAPPADEDASFADPRRLAFNPQFAPSDVADPFPEHRPDDVVCNRVAHRIEYDALELDTGACNYLVLEAPTLAEIVAGDRITVRAFHEDLAALQPAEAHLALAIDGHVVWDERVPVPSPATPYTVTTIADFDAEPDAPVTLHLHNHGLNTYRLIDVRLEAGQ